MFKDIFGNWRYKISLHIHTTLSDGRKSPEEVAKEYKGDGFDAIAITDHWKYREGGELAGLHIISGAEYNIGANETISGTMHIVGFGMEREPQLKKDSATRQDAINAINACGGLAVLAHPAWSLNTYEDAAALSGVDFTEIYNAVSEVQESDRPYSGYFVDICANRGRYFGLLATDDAHYYDGRDSRKGWVAVAADELSDKAIIAALRSGNFYATQGPEVHARREGGKLMIDCSPCEKIITFSNMAWAPSRTLRGEELTHFEYEIKKDDKWVRVEVTDKDGKKAWTNIFKVN